MSQQIPPPHPLKGLRKRSRKRLLSILTLIIITVVLFYVVATPYLAPSIAPPIINADPDKDGLTNEQEKQIGTNPANPDTDNDGLNDGVEVNTYKTNPLVPDSDNDGLNDGLEVNTYHTNPLIADTDGDGLADGLEVNGWWISIDGSQHHVTSNPLSSDSDGDSLSDWSEYTTYSTNPNSGDTDNDGLPDKWEIDYDFAPTNSYDSFKDPDYDGLTNLQEYRLGTITKDGILSYQKDLFIEIDYMSGYEPSTPVINYLVSYYLELNIYVHVTIDDEISWNQLTAIGVSPDSLTSNECYLIEQNFHDNPTTHVYVFYAKALSDEDALGWAGECGAFIDKEKVNSYDGVRFLLIWSTDRIKVEKVVLLHEVGHTINIIKRNQEGEEDYCYNRDCIMTSRAYDDIIDALLQFRNHVIFYDSPRYCNEHATLINLRNKWSVDENWIP